MTKTYTLRRSPRLSTQCTFLYFWNGNLAQGKVWDVSDTGWRATMEQALPAGSETTAYLALPDGDNSEYLVVESATLCWSAGKTAGWKVERLDKAARERLQQYVGVDPDE